MSTRMASVGSREITIWHFPLGICGDQLEPDEIRKWLITDPPRWEAPKVSPMVILSPFIQAFLTNQESG